MNPQYYFHFDKSKVTNPASVMKVDALITFESAHNSDVKLFLFHGHPRNRITYPTEESLFDKSLKQSYYKPGACHLHYNLPPNDFYTVLVSTFKLDQSLGGTLTFESDQPLIIKELPQEGAGLHKTIIKDEWDYRTAGGCQNFGMFDKNPLIAFNLPGDSDVQIRIRVTSEVSQEGGTLVSEFEKFNYCVNLQMFRVQVPRFPPPASAINRASLKNPALTTYDGKYTNNLSGCVSERKSMSAGVYVLVPSTFNPQQMGQFEITVYSLTAVEWAKIA